MQAERVILYTDAQGALIEQPILMPNATIEAIFLAESHPLKGQNLPSSTYFGEGKISEDMVSLKENFPPKTSLKSVLLNAPKGDKLDFGRT